MLRARDERRLELWLTVYGFLLVSWAALLLYVTAEAAWPGVVAFALVVLAHGTVLSGRALVSFVAYASLAFAIATRALAADGALAGSPLTGPNGALAGMTLLFALVVLPVLGALAYAAGARVRLARGRAALTAHELSDAQQQLAASHEELRQWSEHLEEEVARKTRELEERNRHLSIVNATSFALREAIEDAPALERALRLVARLLEAEAAQTYLDRNEPYAPENLGLVASDPEAPMPVAVPEALLAQIHGSGEPLFSEAQEGGEAADLEGLGGFAIVPLTAKGRSMGALAVSGRAERGWSESERRLLMLIGREVSAALEHLLLYRAAIDRAGRAALLNEVTQLLNGEPEVSRAVGNALELVARRLGARTISVVSPLEGRRSQTVVAHVPPIGVEGRSESGPPDPLGAAPRELRGTLLAAPSLVADRSQPLILGPGGEAPRGGAKPGTLLIAPIRTAHARAGALVASSAEDARWGSRESELLGRLAEMIAQRLQSAELVQLQRRRITELAGLAKVAETVQSTIDRERLLSGFARALHQLQPMRALQIAELDDDGAAAGTTTIRRGGEELTHGGTEQVDPGHPWFGLRSAVSWSRGEGPPAAFVADGVDHAVVVPLRAKGRVLGVAAAVTETAPTAEQVVLVEQAIGQLALALDSVSLYQQATRRAARIQVLGNLAQLVASVVDPPEAFDAFAEEVRWLIPFDRALMVRVRRAAGTVERSAAYPRAEEVVGAQPLRGSAAERALDSEGPVLLRRLDADCVGLDWSVFGEDVTEVAAVPVHHGDGEVAIFALAHSRGNSYGDDELELLVEVGRLLAVSIERVQLFAHAERAARHDLLTGLPNYRFLHERLSELQISIDRGRESVLVLIDMDDLKLFNDTLGHGAGDRAIEIVGREIRTACRAEDFVARIGGDEFVVVMEGADLDAAVGMAERVHEALRHSDGEIPGAPTAIRVSAGAAMAPSDSRDVEELLQVADGAMYAAKAAGGGLTRTAASTTERELSRRRRTRARPNRVAEAMIQATTAGASEEERAAAALADRYAVSVARSRGGARGDDPAAADDRGGHGRGPDRAATLGAGSGDGGHARRRVVAALARELAGGDGARRSAGGRCGRAGVAAATERPR